MFKYESRYWRNVGLVSIVFIVLLLFPAIYANAKQQEEYKEIYVTGRVTAILGEEQAKNLMDVMNNSFIRQTVEVRLEDPPFKGQTRTIVHNACLDNPLQGPYLRVGDKVVVYCTATMDGKLSQAYIDGLERKGTVYFLVAVFVLVLIVIGRTRGIAALLSLTAMALLIWYWLLPSMLKGLNPLGGSVVVCLLVSVFSIPLICGFNLKSLCAVIGTQSGVALAGLLAYYTGKQSQIVGIEFEYANFLVALTDKSIQLDLQGIFFAGVLIGTLGAVMDTSVSVASAVQEFIRLNPGISPVRLWRAGMNVGKDAMSTMCSTLILAYTGSAIPLLLLLMAHGVPFVKIFNSDMVVAEIIRSLAGSIGLSLCIPITVLTALILNKHIKPNRKRVEPEPGTGRKNY